MFDCLYVTPNNLPSNQQQNKKKTLYKCTIKVFGSQLLRINLWKYSDSNKSLTKFESQRKVINYIRGFIYFSHRFLVEKIVLFHTNIQKRIEKKNTHT